MFVDQAVINVEAGRGGDGLVHFRRAKFVPRGGPDGGHGGDGGDIWVQATNQVHTLSDYRYKKHFSAENGAPGGPANKQGKNGADLVLPIPTGTEIRNAETQELLVDLTQVGQRFCIAQGGVGGKGNAGFVSSVRQAPKFAEKGDLGEDFALDLQLKLLADIALVGFPNAGKSTLMSTLSNARPKIGDYPFTTINPQLGILRWKDQERTLVDIPGLIEGAHQGKGLGDQFLRHIERAQALLLLVSPDQPEQDLPSQVKILRGELSQCSKALAEKPWAIGLSKADLIPAEQRAELIKKLKKAAPSQELVCFSAATHEGLEELQGLLQGLSPVPLTWIQKQPAEETVHFTPDQDTTSRSVRYKKISPHQWQLTNPRLERLVRQTDRQSVEAERRIYDVLQRWGVLRRLEKEGATVGDSLLIGETTWDYKPLD